MLRPVPEKETLQTRIGRRTAEIGEIEGSDVEVRTLLVDAIRTEIASRQYQIQDVKVVRLNAERSRNIHRHGNGRSILTQQKIYVGGKRTSEGVRWTQPLTIENLSLLDEPAIGLPLLTNSNPFDKCVKKLGLKPVTSYIKTWPPNSTAPLALALFKLPFKAVTIRNVCIAAERKELESHHGCTGAGGALSRKLQFSGCKIGRGRSAGPRASARCP